MCTWHTQKTEAFMPTRLTNVLNLPLILLPEKTKRYWKQTTVTAPLTPTNHSARHSPLCPKDKWLPIGVTWKLPFYFGWWEWTRVGLGWGARCKLGWSVSDVGDVGWGDVSWGGVSWCGVSDVGCGWCGLGWCELGRSGLMWGWGGVEVGCGWCGMGWFELGWADVGVGWCELGRADVGWGWCGCGWCGVMWVGAGWCGLGVMWVWMMWGDVSWGGLMWAGGDVGVDDVGWCELGWVYVGVGWGHSPQFEEGYAIPESRLLSASIFSNYATLPSHGIQKHHPTIARILLNSYDWPRDWRSVSDASWQADNQISCLGSRGDKTTMQGPRRGRGWGALPPTLLGNPVDVFFFIGPLILFTNLPNPDDQQSRWYFQNSQYIFTHSGTQIPKFLGGAPQEPPSLQRSCWGPSRTLSLLSSKSTFSHHPNKCISEVVRIGSINHLSSE